MWKKKKEKDINFYDDSYLSKKIIIGKKPKEKNVNDNEDLDEYSLNTFDLDDTKIKKLKKWKKGKRKEDWL
jgi:hypothetical protein